jgi:DNA replication protein DnaC
MSDAAVQLRRPLSEEDVTRLRIPPRFWEVSLAEVRATSLIAPLKKYLANLDEVFERGVGLLLHGDNGRGKTGAACVILMEARRRGYTGLFLEAAKMKTIVISREEFDEDQTLWERAQTVDFLVLDDLWKGSSDSKGFGEELLDELLRTRSACMRPTIITSNMGPVQAIQAGAVKKSTVQSMRETTAYVEVVGPNLREEHERSIAEFFRN